jgi:glutamate-1-semialdehyde 2,1-aminomutase
MMSTVSQGVATAIIDKYVSRTQRSKASDARARRYLPGGDTRASTYFFPYPCYMERGEEFHIYDCDGNGYIDFLNNYTSLIHGHAWPPIVRAVEAQLSKGTVFGSATAAQRTLAEMLCERLPSVETLRFTNSGTEATMMAIRAARAFTGKDVILKMDGGFHGGYDFVEVNVRPDSQARGLPLTHLEGAGIPTCVLDSTMVAPFNNLDAVEMILRKHKDKIAAIIVEPMPHAGGMIPPRVGYLHGIRDLADRHDVLLIFDEIVTFRLGLGGLQAVEHVEPDLTTLGKIIGGGFPVGAFGGKEECMKRFDPAHPQTIKHSGTFNGNNITMVAGVATLQDLDQAAIDRINSLGEKMRRKLNQTFQAVGIKGQATGIGSLLQVHWGDEEMLSPRDAFLAAKSARDLPNLLHLELMNRGIFSVPRGAFNISSPMRDEEIDLAVEAFKGALGLLKPYVAEQAPHLIAG